MSSLFKKAQTADDICLILGYNRDRFTSEQRRSYLTEIGQRTGGTELLAEVERKMLNLYLETPIGSNNGHKYWLICEDARRMLNQARLRDAKAELAKLDELKITPKKR